MGRWAVLGAGMEGVVEVLTAEEVEVEEYPHLQALHGAIDAGDAVPDVVLLDCTGGNSAADAQALDARKPNANPNDTVRGAHAATRRALGQLQAWLADERLSTARLVFMTRGAVAAGSGEDVLDLIDRATEA